ncbi:hypothetical protein [Nocardioides sp.]|uniref:hypothetical protein n=1 Tax=Nocardioides sp. TaxID=35761 RepID=UPI002B2722E4|nr:hypothetical protein [Nocardioides sp.]
MQLRIATCAVLIAVLAGCSTDEGEVAAPTATPSASRPTQSEPPAPDVAPATGARLTIEHLGEPVATYRAPTEKWVSTGRVASKATVDGSFYLGGGAGITYPEISLDDAAELNLENIERTIAPVERLENRTVDGIEGYVLEGGKGPVLYYEFGATYEDSFVTISLESPIDTSKVRADIESVLASVRWQ